MIKLKMYLLGLLCLWLVLACGQNLDKALLNDELAPSVASQPPGNTSPPNIDNPNEPPPDDNPDPGPGDDGETGTPPIETSTLSEISNGSIAAMGVYVPSQVNGLKGKMIAVGAGHGWRGRTSSESAGKRLQRSWHWASGSLVYNSANTGGVSDKAVVEDYMNNEITGYLNQYLRNAGAETTLVRELSHTKEQVVVCPGGAGYSEIGGTFHTSTNDSAMAGLLCAAGTKYHYINGDALGSASFSYSASVPSDGLYPVYYHYRDGTDREASVPVTITHAGGVVRTVVDLANRAQTTDAYGSVGLRYRVAYLGEYYFKTSAPAVVTFNSQFAADKIAVADVLRIGGGLDTVPIDGSPTNEELWKSSAFQYQKFLNRPGTVARLSGGYNEDVTTRPHAANYEMVDAFVSVHNNATGSGTYPYQSNSGKGSMIIYQYGAGATYKPLDEVSRVLGRNILDKMVAHIRERWDPSWTKITWGYDGFDGNYGETRVAQVPAALVEIAFFTQYQDLAALSNEHFYQIAARGVYHGIADFFNIGYAPEEVDAVRVSNTGDGEITLSWDVPAVGAGAAFYVVRTSKDGKAFDSGRTSAQPYAIFSNVPPGTAYHFTVQAGNENGISLPSEVVSVKVPQNVTDKKLLIVNGFDRFDNIINSNTTYGIRGVNNRIERGNLRNHTPTYLSAVVDSGRAWSLSSCGNEAVTRGYINLSDYDAVIWYVGRESWADETFSYDEQVIIQAYLDGGGHFAATGSEIGWDLKKQTVGNLHANDVPFLENYLHTSYAADDAGTNSLLAGTGVLSGVPASMLDDGTQGSYESAYPDYYNPINGSTCVQQYATASRCAALYFSGSYKLFSFGYPLEIILESTKRQAIIDKILQAFE